MNGTSYRFRLERVRALRERSEDQAKQQLASALQSRHACQQEVDDAALRINGVRHAQSGAHAHELLAYQEYLEHSERLHRERLDELKGHDELVAERRNELVRAAQAHEALARLKARGLADHTLKLLRNEQNQLDEIAIGGYWRRTT